MIGSRAKPPAGLGFRASRRHPLANQPGNRPLSMERQLVVNLPLGMRTFVVCRTPDHDDAFRGDRSSTFESAAALRRQAAIC